MKNLSTISACALCMAAVAAGRSGAAELQPQHLGVKAAIEPGSNVFTLDQEWGGASSINIFAGSDLKYKGNLSSGTMAQMLLSHDGRTAYTASVFMKRIVYGDAEMVLQVFDVATSSAVREVVLPAKLAMLTPYRHMLAESADGKYVFVQNATPATSVTVVDVQAGKVTGEVPTPGCFGIYPALDAKKFSVVCGDGTFASYVLKADGSGADRTPSQKIFDVDQDPIFLSAQRVASDLIYVSYHGNVYRVSDAQQAATLVERFSLTTGTTGGWAPGGYEMIAYNKAHGVLFVGMHPNAKDGSHKTPAKEIWAYDLAQKKLLHRSSVPEVKALTASDDAAPSVFALKDKAIVRYAADPNAGFALKKTEEHLNAGEYNLEVEVRQ
jgi:methylamine dehydrogenase heavy chain